MSWRIARSIDTLRRQVNARWPARDKASDGTIGDARHATKDSDHNPWLKVVENGRTIGVVTAIDIDKDLSPTEKVDVVVNALLTHRDSRIKYIIWRGRIISSYPARGYPAWVWRKYSGSNGHFEHMHLSVSADPKLFDNPREWNLGTGWSGGTATEPTPTTEEYYFVQPGDRLWQIASSNRVPYATLLELNPQIENVDLLKINQRIRIR